MIPEASDKELFGRWAAICKTAVSLLDQAIHVSNASVAQIEAANALIRALFAELENLADITEKME